ncbi:MAG: hypothetical protein L6Q38_12835 [Nitrospira sp.]|nr:hypothetical protein [Planctomycetota bacterium]MCK6500352.1 hypothetical protein [Nitrospira sp.]
MSAEGQGVQRVHPAEDIIRDWTKEKNMISKALYVFLVIAALVVLIPGSETITSAGTIGAGGKPAQAPLSTTGVIVNYDFPITVYATLGGDIKIVGPGGQTIAQCQGGHVERFPGGGWSFDFPNGHPFEGTDGYVDGNGNGTGTLNGVPGQGPLDLRFPG